MGNKNTNATSLAIIKKEDAKPYSSFDYNKFLQNQNQIVTFEYDGFQDFIEKQSLKTLHHILIVQGVNEAKIIDDTQINHSELPSYMVPVEKLLDSRGTSSNKLSIRDKVINYIKKYSLENLNLYFYVPKLKNFVVPEPQVPYITLVSNESSTIINHILNEQSEKLVNVKFKGLMKDLYRRKLVAVISKDWNQKIQKKIDAEKQRAFLQQLQKIQKKQKKQKSKLKDSIQHQDDPFERSARKPTQKSQFIMNTLVGTLTAEQSKLQKMLKEFNSHENRFESLFVESIDAFRNKLKSMYFEFVICMDKENLLELIEFKKRMPVQSKIIYFGNISDLQTQKADDLLSSQASKVILKKKLSQIWWIQNNLEQQICPVMKKWWNNKYQIQKNLKISTNIIIYLCRTQNIVRKKQIEKIIRSQIQSLNEWDLDRREKGTDLLKKINLTVEFKPDAVAQRYHESLYTNVIMFDATNEEFQEMKKLAFIKFKGQPRLQVTLVQYKPKNPADQKSKKKDKNQKNNQKITEKDTQIDQKIPLESQFLARIKNCKDKLQLKFQISPIENVCCINIDDDDIEFLKNKMGLKVETINTNTKEEQQEKTKTGKNKENSKQALKQFQKYFPKYMFPIESKKYKNLGEISKILGVNNPRLHIGSTFENFLIICSFEDYLAYLFPFFMMANFFKQKFIFESKSEQRPKFDVLSQRDWFNVQVYLQKIKVIIYDRIDMTKKKNSHTYDLHKVLELHKIDHLALNCIRQAIYKYLGLNYTKTPQIELQMNNQGNQKKDNKGKVFDKEEIDRYVEWVKTQVLQVQNSKNAQNNEVEKQVKIVFPGIVFVHYKLSQVEDYLNFYKYNKLSMSNFPKDSLKSFFKAHQKIQTIFMSKSFSLDATFVSSNNLLKQVFEKKNIQVSPKHKMQFIRFSSNKQSEMAGFQDYVKKYAGLWKMKFQLFRKDGQSRLVGSKADEAFQSLKNDVKRAFQKCKYYELLKVSTSEFKHFYIDRIQKCQTLLDLQIAAIYIYSLPHGVSEIVGVIFEDPSKSVLSLEIFNSFLFLLFANFFSLESRTLQKISTVIYVDQEKIRNVYQHIRENDIMVNQNILHILNDQNTAENQKNHCVFIDYQNIPWMKKSSLTPILKIQNFSFYKESAEFILAPFTKLKLKERKFVNKQYYKLYFEVIPDYDSNIFLKTFFELNGITDIEIFKALDHWENIKVNATKKKEARQKDSEEEQNAIQPDPLDSMGVSSKQMKRNLPKSNNSLNQGKQKKQPQKSNPKSSSQAEEHNSLYRQAEQTSLKEQKEILRKSIRLILTYMNMLYSLKDGKIFSAESHFYQIYDKTLGQLNDNDQNDKKYEQIKQEIELNKLKIQKAMLYAKMNDYSKAIQELDGLLNFLKYQKVQENTSGTWMKNKIIEMKQYISNLQKVRQNQINKIKQLKKWTIAMQDTQLDHYSEKTNTVVYNPPVKWKVRFNDKKQTFIMDSQDQIVEPKKYNVFSNYINPELASAQAAKREEKQKKKRQQQKPDDQTFSLGDFLFELFDEEAKLNQNLDVRGKGAILDQEIIKMNTLFDYMIKTKQLRLLKLLHVYVKFWSKIVNVDESKRKEQVWKTLRQKIPQFYTMQKFLILAQDEFFQFRPKQKNSSRTQEWFRDFLISFEKTLNEQKILSLQQQILEQHLQRQQVIKGPQLVTVNGKGGKRCWIDEGLGLQNQRMDWSVFEFDNRMIVVDAKRKWKQSIGNGLNLVGKTFVRSQNQVINLDKTRKSRIDN